MDVKDKSLELLKEEERIFEDLLSKVFDKSINGLNETANEINRLEKRHSPYDFYFYQISNLKTNINYIEEQYDSKMRILSNEIKEEIKSSKEIFSLTPIQFQSNINKEENIKYLNELLNQIDHFTANTSYQLLLKSIFDAFGIFTSIESIIALFTGIGVLGIVPLRMPFVINNAASEMMFRDKLKELDEKLRWIIENIRMKKNDQLEHLHLYFDHFRMKLSQ